MAFASLSDMDEQYGDGPIAPRSEEVVGWARLRIAHLQRTDPAGAWVAVDGSDIVGIALSLRRGPMWFLSLLAVATSHQARGIGRELLDTSLRTADGAGAVWLLATSDPKALRRYALAGFALHAAYTAKGALDRSVLPAVDVRAGEWNRDAALVDEVATFLRGAPYGPDLEVMQAMSAELLIVDDSTGRGFCVHGPRGIACVGATTPVAAQRLLWAGLAESPSPDVAVMWLTADQQWAIDVCLAARLSLRPGPSSARRSTLGPLTPFLPTGAYG
jgi:predicted N-acetyltransferase YhbS